MFSIKSSILRIAAVSFLILFLEILIIRLVSTEIRIFAYIANALLLTIFVGSGLGMLIKRKVPLYVSAVGIFILTAILSIEYIVRLPNVEFKLFSGLTELLAPLSESYIWFQINTYSKTGIVIGLFLTVLVLLLVGVIFLPLGQFLGRQFDKSNKPIVAYTYNILASLLGMWIFQGISILGISPYLGIFASLVVLLFILEGRDDLILCTIFIVGTIILLLPREAHQPYEGPVVFWSPYQKLTLSSIAPNVNLPRGWYLEVNNVGYMGLLDLSSSSMDKKREVTEKIFKGREGDINFANQYDLPYKIMRGAGNVLIIGGGAGNDAAAAVRAGVRSIDVVEIDPMIVTLGRKYHPEKPYDKKNIRVYVDDGRAYLEKTKTKYDIVIMSLADSHTSSSSLTNVQLDNYLYTREALSKVKSILSERGVFFLTFEVTRPWIGERLSQTLIGAFSYQPKIFEVRSEGIFGWGGYMFVSARDKNILENLFNNDKNLKNFVEKNEHKFSKVDNVLTDNWPYIYLDKPRIPTLHGIVALIGVSGLLFLRTKLFARSFSAPFFFLGAGFMLFEVQNIIKSSLVFGNTWVTNLFIITGVLSFILVANLAVVKKLISLNIAFLLLVAMFILQMFVPVSFFNSLSGSEKIILSLVFLTLPHFFSGVIFVYLFSVSKNRAVAFGNNLLGSAVGGLLSILSYLWGINSLLYLTVILYVFGFLWYKLRGE
ncbi:hypothetical protein A2773_03430 [Candidatus Gottesmanbacteria bacterium RIFCSPHIGHO2_01_FULL_39_10]|uniref:PABS domain-containing protein n=1 Tax=Candidatus Gottesmanbacteria bacterium RIFCSPHIGHO2_01_FULL_39_10 TaxID=1798375 RepID=A0A1F5ZPQ5_9BACT|nr:MAG: hypothetical protein A2773_03430 [Candidatus Gottesmanbacteria bacterium RIFCSPHIGHO2_01_FULL_39_10]